MAIAATTALSFWAGTRLAAKHPKITPGMPPISNCSRIDVLIEPIVQCTALPMTANTSPNNMSVPTT
jgi:hypothetical protein